MNSRPGIYSSASTDCVRPDAAIIVRVHSSCVRTIETPALEPLARGLTTIGGSSEPGSSGSVPPDRSNVSQAGVGKPSAAKQLLG